MDTDALKPILAGIVRHGLTTAGGALVAGGYIQSSDTSAFVGGGMVLAGIAWSWWQKSGQAQTAALLKKLTASRSHTEAVEKAEAMPSASPVAVNNAIIQNVTGKVVTILLIAFVISAFLLPRADAADVLATKAISNALSSRGYPDKHCGVYYGVGTGGNAGAVNGAAVGTQIVQGDLDAIVGYTCPFADNAFWFAEGSFGFSNLNGSTNGLALSGPLVAIERVGAGSPINNILGSLMPANINPSLPSIPLLPAGVTTSPGNGYLFVGLVQQDIGAQIGALSGHQWVVAPMLGAGILTRASNNVMIDTWAGWQMNSNSFCPGGGSACAKLGNMARVGVSFKY